VEAVITVNLTMGEAQAGGRRHSGAGGT